MENLYAVPVSKEPDIITIRNQEANEILRIAPDGRIFWKQREVETDDDFRAAMLELKEAMTKNLQAQALPDPEIDRLRGAMLTAASMLERDGDEHGVGYALRRAMMPNAGNERCR